MIVNYWEKENVKKKFSFQRYLKTIVSSNRELHLTKKKLYFPNITEVIRELFSPPVEKRENFSSHSSIHRHLNFALCAIQMLFHKKPQIFPRSLRREWRKKLPRFFNTVWRKFRSQNGTKIQTTKNGTKDLILLSQSTKKTWWIFTCLGRRTSLGGNESLNLISESTVQKFSLPLADDHHPTVFTRNSNR